MVSHTVGGGPAAASPQHAPFELAPGEAMKDQIRSGSADRMELCARLVAGSKAVQQFVLRASDYVSWICTEDQGYTFDFCVKISAKQPHSQVRCVNQRLKLVGVDRSRLVSEKSRGKAFQGYLDLAGEHAGCLSQVETEDPVALLQVEVDNSFSFFTEKSITLQVSRRMTTVKSTRSVKSLAAEPPVDTSPLSRRSVSARVED